MGRPKALDRKQQLLDQILEHLRNRTLASVTFRTLADALGVSSYVLVYQFGNRNALLGDIVREVDYRILNLGFPEEMSVDFNELSEMSLSAFGEMMNEKDRHYLRLQMEGAAMDIVSDAPTHATGRYLEMWVDFMEEYFQGLKYTPEAASSLAAGFINELSGIRYRFTLLGDRESSLVQVEEAIQRLRMSMEARAEYSELSPKEIFSTKVTISPKAQFVAVENRPDPAR